MIGRITPPAEPAVLPPAKLPACCPPPDKPRPLNTELRFCPPPPPAPAPPVPCCVVSFEAKTSVLKITGRPVSLVIFWPNSKRGKGVDSSIENPLDLSHLLGKESPCSEM